MNYLYTLVTALLLTLNVHAANVVVTNTNNAGAGSLRDQILGASNGDTIRFSPSLIAGGSSSIVLSSKIIFSTNLTIVGLYNSTDTLYISGGNTTGVFRINNVNKVYFDSVVIVNGKSDWGGAIRFSNSDSLIVRNSIFRSNSVTQGGGAIHAYNYVSIENSTVSNNSATFSGGGVYAPNVKILNSIISSNIAANTWGGGVYAQYNVSVNNSIISNNDAEERGGGICVDNGTCDVINSTISGNSVVNNGGGIYAFWVSLINSSVNNNTAKYGGGIDFIIILKAENNSTIDNNFASINGGGVHTENSTDSILVYNSSISNNTANGKGGGIYGYESSGSNSNTWIKLNNAIINNNMANWGGGIHVNSYFSARFLFTIDNSSLSNNISTANAGGGIYSYASVTQSWMTINNSTFSNNQAYSGGGLYSTGASSSLTIKTSTFSNNSVSNIGGGIGSSSSGYNNTIIENCTVYENIAGTSGNGIYGGTVNLNGSILFNPGGSSNLAYSLLNSTGYNIFNDATLPGMQASDILGVNNVQLNLGPLQNNGGLTETHLPDFNSIAFDTGNPAITTDAQNGPIMGIRDRGAAEGNCTSRFLNEVIACESYTWSYNGQTYVNDTIITDTIFNGNVNGCDSLVTLDLAISYNYLYNQDIDICQGDSVLIYGNYELTAGIYYDSLLNIHGCDSVLTTTVSINPIPNVNAGVINPNIICANSNSFILPVGSPSGGIYTGNGVSGGNFAPANAGIGTHEIIYTYTDGNSCMSSDTTHITINSTFSSNQNTAICQGDSLLMYGIYQNSAGVYYDSLTTINGCDSVYSTTLSINPLPVVDLDNFNQDTLCEYSSPVVLPTGTPAGGTYAGNGIIGSDFNPALAGIGSHEIIYLYTDGSSCINSDTSIIIVDGCVGITSLSNDFGISIYPNPSSGQFTIEKPKDFKQNVQIRVLDVTSRIMLYQLIPYSIQKVEIDISNYSNGIYYLQLEVKGEMFIKQIVKY